MELESNYHSYIVIFGQYYDKGFMYGSSDSLDEIYAAISEEIFERLAYIEDTGYDYTDFAGINENEEEMRMYVDLIKRNKIIKNPAILADCFEKFFESCWFTVIDANGEELFGYHRGD
jgi:hypothetical protein